MFLPINKEDMKRLGWDAPDFLLVSGDAYVDHPSFGHAIISRVLEAEGFRVAILAQPDWTGTAGFLSLGKPKLGVLVAPGVVDSMVNHYTAAKKRRGEDSYSPGGAAGRRPDRALITYCNRIRSAMRGIPLIIGGVEAGLRTFAHYDYWDDYVRRSVLIDSGADLLVYGMGEAAIAEVARRLRDGEAVGDIKDVDGTAYVDSENGFAARRAAEAETLKPDGSKLKFVELPPYEDVSRAKKTYAEAFLAEYREQDPIRGNVVFQRHGASVVVKNPPSAPMSSEALDRVYALPYERAWHPSYDAAGGVPALEEVRFSVTSHRGCFGGCSFCAINLHQGRIVQKRSLRSIVGEVELLARSPGFKGYIHDIGGPSANLRDAACNKQLRLGTCRDRRCLGQKPCKNLEVSHRDYLNVLRCARRVPGVKKVFIRSGVRYDYIMLDRDSSFIKEMCEHHVSGQLKVAPEHVSKGVLALMGKPCADVFEAFSTAFLKENIRLNLKQYLVPYLISGHPGTLLSDAVELAEYLCRKNIHPEQVQDFYPTPGTLSTCMYYTGIDPMTMKKVHIPEGEEKAMQRALLQFRRPENRGYVLNALHLTGRTDLIGYGKGCLARPEREFGNGKGGARDKQAGRQSGGGGSGQGRQAGGDGSGQGRQAGGNGSGQCRQAGGNGSGRDGVRDRQAGRRDKKSGGDRHAASHRHNDGRSGGHRK